MKPKDIIIATALILTLSSILSGCQLIESNEEVSMKPVAGVDQQEVATKENTSKKPRIPKRAQALIQKAEFVKKEVKMVFEKEVENDKVKITVYLENPNKKPITSVQTWLSFNPELIEGLEMVTGDSAFTLPAPYKNGFDNEEGLMMLGRSNPEAITDTKIPVVVATFSVKTKGVAVVDIYDYREDLSGHTSVNTVLQGEPHNILIKPESPAFAVGNNS